MCEQFSFLTCVGVRTSALSRGKASSGGCHCDGRGGSGVQPSGLGTLGLAAQQNGLVFECFPYVCPEPVLAKCSFLCNVHTYFMHKLKDRFSHLHLGSATPAG